MLETLVAAPQEEWDSSIETDEAPLITIRDIGGEG